MYTNDDYFEKWMQKLYSEIRDISGYLKVPHGAKVIFGENELHLDNQDLCRMLRVSHRTLQHYRTDDLLSFLKRGQKIYYKASDVREFVNRNNFDHRDRKSVEDRIQRKKELNFYSSIPLFLPANIFLPGRFSMKCKRRKIFVF
jgi:DNA-binding transcriptional MerR regulator